VASLPPSDSSSPSSRSPSPGVSGLADVSDLADLAIGIDIGGTKVLGVLIADDGTVVAEARASTPTSGAELLDVVASVVEGVRPGGSPLPAVGVGAPGLVDRQGVLRFAPNIPGIVGLSIRSGLTALLPGTAVRVGNDATCAGWAERVLGAGRGRDNVLMVTLGTGIGGGLVVEGMLLEGANGFAGEIGHMVVDPNGPRCPCGRRGCWERFASGSGLGRLGREAAHAGEAARVVELAGGDPEAVRGEHVTVAAREGDAGAMVVVGQYAWWLALGLANLANTFDPAALLLAGGLVEAGDILLEPTRAAFADLVEANDHRPPIMIAAAVLGERAGAIGAADLARRAARR
jgi:glucokinase